MRKHAQGRKKHGSTNVMSIRPARQRSTLHLPWERQGRCRRDPQQSPSMLPRYEVNIQVWGKWGSVPAAPPRRNNASLSVSDDRDNCVLKCLLEDHSLRQASSLYYVDLNKHCMYVVTQGSEGIKDTDISDVYPTSDKRTAGTASSPKRPQTSTIHPPRVRSFF